MDCAFVCTVRFKLKFNIPDGILAGIKCGNSGSVPTSSSGEYVNTNNSHEAAFGGYNISNIGSTDADKTIFSVGNGTADNARHNAFEIRQNGDIYLTLNGQDVKLQDQLGSGFIPENYYDKTATDTLLDAKANSSDLTSHTSNTDIHVTSAEKTTWNNKSNFSGSYNDLTNKPTIPTYTAGNGITITNNVISAKVWSGTKAQYEALTNKDADCIYLIYEA